VQAIIVAIDQYAEAATGNREFFLNKPLLSWNHAATGMAAGAFLFVTRSLAHSV
jgi:hypothetical protein